MKKIFLSLFLVIFATTALWAQNRSIRNLIGKWESSDGGGIEVTDSANIYLLYNGEKKQISSFQCDFSKTPCWFDFTIKDSSGNMVMKSLLMFVTDNLLQWQVFESDRPADFDAGASEIIYLRRKR